MHVDEFIVDPDTDEYASFFLLLARLEARLILKFKKQIQKYNSSVPIKANGIV
jgi:hypothetical protein